MNKSIPEAVLEAVARAICMACEENPDHQGDARGNEFRWQDYRDTALTAISALAAAQQPAEGEDIMVNTPYDVFILPLRPSGLDGKGPRFVVHVPGPEQPAAHPAITHCDNCGCDWLDNGLNPVGCPYCKQHDERIESESNYPTKYYKQGGTIYAVHGTSSINCVERLLAKIETLQAENEHLREALKDIRSCSLIDLIMQSNPVELTTRLGDIYQIANTALVKENRND